MRRVLCLLLLALVPSAAFAAPLLDTFDSGLQGWTVSGDNAYVWDPVNGHPGGCHDVNDTAVGLMNYALASNRWLGDWSALGAGDTLSVDVLQQLLSGTVTPPAHMFVLQGPGGRATAIPHPNPANNAWTAYFHADRLNYAVCGTPNRLEHDQGFFVKGGDGASDFKPIAHLFKTQVFALARYMGVPEGICKRTPTTDTYSLPQTQEEFYFALPHEKMDICLYGYNHGIPARELAETLDLHPDQVERVFHDIEAERHATLPLHLPPILIEEVPEISRALKQGTGQGCWPREREGQYRGVRLARGRHSPIGSAD